MYFTLRFIVKAVLAWTLAVSGVWAQGVEKAPVQHIQALKQCAKPWLDGYITISQMAKEPKTLGFLNQFKDTLANAAYAIPLPKNEGKPRIKIVSPVPDPKRPWIVLVPMCDKNEIQSQMASRNQMAIYESTLHTITLDGTEHIPQTIKGLIVAHELVHAHQFAFRRYQSNPVLREYEAFETQFQIMDEMKLPGYEEALARELTRVQNEKGGIKINIGNKYLDTMFPDIGIRQKSRVAAAWMLMMRAVFKIYDQEGPGALEKKIKFIESLGY